MATYKISKNASFRRAVAEAILTETWVSERCYYADLLNDKVMAYEKGKRPVDSSAFVRVGDLAPSARDVSEAVEDWEEALSSKKFSLEDIKKAYIADNASIDEIDAVIEWAMDQYDYSSLIEECKGEAYEAAISFILEEFLEEIQVSEEEEE